MDLGATKLPVDPPDFGRALSRGGIAPAGRNEIDDPIRGLAVVTGYAGASAEPGQLLAQVTASPSIERAVSFEQPDARPVLLARRERQRSKLGQGLRLCHLHKILLVLRAVQLRSICASLLVEPFREPLAEFQIVGLALLKLAVHRGAKGVSQGASVVVRRVAQAVVGQDPEIVRIETDLERHSDVCVAD